ncbi:hypothetical protein AWB75_04228 [Caballeronia catudaia]|uniref:Lipoprotein n=1 Tax=Caballeronia catudaia TaxID=1777136 RepID=A0A158BYT6_9BURK|nr:hypothetical protein [Caballeronia catudaia]SAK75252.1 hypothetical protein AWB75_04228 [Caballeronia catudaia]
MKSMLRVTSIVVAFVLSTTIGMSGASAAGHAASFRVALTVSDTCTMVAATPVADSTSSDLTVRCSGRTAPYVLQGGDFEPQFGKAVRLLAGEGDIPVARYTLRHGTTRAESQARTKRAEPGAGKSANDDGAAADAPGDPLSEIVPTTIVF